MPGFQNLADLYPIIMICTQAGVTPLTLDFLKDCGRTDTHVIRNTFQRFQNLPVNFYKRKDDCTAHLRTCARKKHR
jgi:hypothetical protein